MIGLLHFLAHYQTLGLQTVLPAISKTSLPKTWNEPNRLQGINPGEVQEITIQKVKLKDGSAKRSYRIRSTLYNPIPDDTDDLSVVDEFKERRQTIRINTASHYPTLK